MRLALFDLDHTLLTVDTDEQWVEFLIVEGHLEAAATGRAMADLMERYARGDAGTVEFTCFYLATFSAFTLPQLEALRVRFVRDRIEPAVCRGTRALLAQHRGADDRIVLTTATNRYLTAPIAALLGVPHLIATDPEIVDGRFTGRIDGIPNMRAGKVERLCAWLAGRDERLEDFAESWFYSDSVNDLPLLERVSHPVAVNGDPRLAPIAAARGWRTVDLR